MALGSAMATLLAALFVCIGMLADARTDHTPPPGITVAVHTTAGTGTDAKADCPYDRGDCGMFGHLSPAVLTAPPLDGPADEVGDRPVPATVPGTGRLAHTGVLPRAPDLHVLQVQRT
ncbi:hypothetical protein [Streptomyces sp. NPDC059828]|uniref:hypothetical protein n=1 Tax=Streptomyces sp. NPDC059828 TaxID=3346965 RepID=UPI00365421ED